MIRFTQGNILEAETEAAVNAVNSVGVMGKGIALAFKKAFPANFDAYAAACKRGDVGVGRMFVTRNDGLVGPQWIINFPTKRHWRDPSRMEWIRDGLRDLARVITEEGIRSIAVPALGCGNGGLNWAEVRAEIVSALGSLEGVEIVVYEPVVSGR
ncbi:MAG: macro domain-containing protein [Candidatus Hydrogenedentes bacterium]|nr:macro domain-containing protein [Candidatus Hydrogenedentota bacterium]